MLLMLSRSSVASVDVPPMMRPKCLIMMVRCIVTIVTKASRPVIFVESYTRAKTGDYTISMMVMSYVVDVIIDMAFDVVFVVMFIIVRNPHGVVATTEQTTKKRSGTPGALFAIRSAFWRA